MKELIYQLNATAQVKFGISLPLPWRNHYYKGKSLAFQYHWFCADCNSVFNLTPFRKYTGILMSDLCCQSCGSKDIYHSIGLSKAIIDGNPTIELHQITTLLKHQKPN